MGMSDEVIFKQWDLFNYDFSRMKHIGILR